MRDKKSNSWLEVDTCTWHRVSEDGRVLAVLTETPYGTWSFKDQGAAYSYSSLEKAKEGVEKHW